LKTFRPSQTSTATLSGLVLSAVIAIPFILFLFLGRQGPLVFQSVMAALFAVVSGFMLYATLSGRKMSYELGDCELRVNFGFWKVKVPYHSIKDVQLSRLTLILRIFGGSWPGLHWGLFKATDIGRVYAYSTRVRGDFVLINLVDDKMIAITPEDPENFMREIDAYKSAFGKADRESTRLFETSKRTVYAQVLIVASAYLLLLGYFLSVYPSLPEVIPVHFDLNWNPNRWADKSELFIMMGIASIFPIINTVFVMSFGKYGKGFTIFLGVIFILVMVLFSGIINAIQSMA